MRDLEVKRIVVKIGTNTICRDDGTVDQGYIDEVARQVVELDGLGIQSIVVTSGAIGSGSSELKLDGKKKDVPMKQACAAVGQATLMLAWREAFRKHGRSVGQVLLTYGAFSDRARYLDLQKAIAEMFRLGVVPVVNENDVISTDEIEEIFGDNDKLSALVASKMDADLLVLMDVDGLYDRNPEADSQAKRYRSSMRSLGTSSVSPEQEERAFHRRHALEDQRGQDRHGIRVQHGNCQRADRGRDKEGRHWRGNWNSVHRPVPLYQS